MEEYDFALRYEGRMEPEGPWIEVLVPATSLEEAQAGYDLSLPTMEGNENLRNLEVVYTPKIKWSVWPQ
ncbi:hypothetical protein SEA_SUPERCHUNK_32 [Mycobacterium phage Superchunk]|nr:hypothetical protein SEA_SUPERCHUNK_32 [Mycobacterium phage Superchunk]